MLKGLKEFLFKPEVIGFAIAVIFAGAIGAVIASLVADVIMPIIGFFLGDSDFSKITLGPILIGNFINAIINFLIMGTALYFLGNAAKNAFPEPEPGPSQEDLLGEIRDLLKRNN